MDGGKLPCRTRDRQDPRRDEGPWNGVRRGTHRFCSLCNRLISNCMFRWHSGQIVITKTKLPSYIGRCSMELARGVPFRSSVHIRCCPWSCRTSEYLGACSGPGWKRSLPRMAYAGGLGVPESGALTSSSGLGFRPSQCRTGGGAAFSGERSTDSFKVAAPSIGPPTHPPAPSAAGQPIMAAGC